MKFRRGNLGSGPLKHGRLVASKRQEHPVFYKSRVSHVDRSLFLSFFHDPPDMNLAINGYVTPLNRAMRHAF